MKTMDFYLIRAISNLHVGSGEGDFSVIDKQVQRDQITNLPIIHASGIKGALREAMEYDAKNSSEDEKRKNKLVLEVFGSDPKRNNSIQQGKYIFYDAFLLALPARSSHDFFYLATCQALLSEAAEQLERFLPENEYIPSLRALAGKASEEARYFGKNQSGNIRLEEEWIATYNNHDLGQLAELFGNRLALLSNEAFDRLAKALPIIARNYLEDGVSGNLWHEEVVPREARFLTMVSREEDSGHLNDFLKKQKWLAQLGANATVGYGLCSFKKIS